MNTKRFFNGRSKPTLSELIDQVLEETSKQPLLQEKVFALRDALFHSQQIAQQLVLKNQDDRRNSSTNLNLRRTVLARSWAKAKDGLYRIVVGGTEYQAAVAPELLEDSDALKTGDQVALNEGFVAIAKLPLPEQGPLVKNHRQAGQAASGWCPANQHGFRNHCLPSPGPGHILLKGWSRGLPRSQSKSDSWKTSQTGNQNFYSGRLHRSGLETGRRSGKSDRRCPQGDRISDPAQGNPQPNGISDAQGLFVLRSPRMRKNSDRQRPSSPRSSGNSKAKKKKNCKAGSSTSKARKSSICGWANPNEKSGKFSRKPVIIKKKGEVPFIFIDEAESVLGTRQASRGLNISNTLVPMFCAEMDGIQSLRETVVILATNRPDLIDPAILTTGPDRPQNQE